MSAVRQDNVRHFPDGPSLIRSSINVEHRNWLCQSPEREANCCHILRVNKVGGCTAVHQAIDGEFEGVLRGPEFQWQMERVDSRGCGDGVALGKSALPAWPLDLDLWWWP